MTPSKLALQVAEERGPDQSIPRLATARTAFVGRTLRGPVNRPVSIKSFVEFQQIFGGLWQPSLLGYAVEQFFDSGGRDALIVRVVNGARSATLTLKAGGQALQLQALRPGTREFLRASVDFDNIAPDELEVFNLTVQRVRAQGTGQVDDQEIFHRLSVSRTDERYLPAAIAQSALIRLAGEMPALRPDRTLDPASGLATAYVNSNSDGDDGAPLTDYDLIGSSLNHTGVFALHLAEYFNFLCIPPLSRDRDVGPSALLVAARYCKERRALLIVDPPSGWQTADDALSGLRDWNFPDENALMYFPRVLAHDKLRGHFESFAPCGAVAGMLARSEEGGPLWLTAEREEPILRPGLRPACLVSEDRRIRLAQPRRQHAAGGPVDGAHQRAPAHLGRRQYGQRRLALPVGAAAGALHLEQHRTGDALGHGGGPARGDCAGFDHADARLLRGIAPSRRLRRAADGRRVFRHLRRAGQ